MKKTVKLIFLFTLLFSIVTLTACSELDDSNSQGSSTTSESQESDGKITQAQYDKIKTGMSYDEVKKITGSEGQNIFESGDKGTDNYSISYMWLGKNSGEATIGFTGKTELKVLMKSQSGLK